MTCREVIDFLMEYLNGELSPAQKSSFDHHLSLCPACQKYLASYRTAVELGKKSLKEEDVPPVPEALVKAILAAKKKP